MAEGLLAASKSDQIWSQRDDIVFSGLPVFPGNRGEGKARTGLEIIFGTVDAVNTPFSPWQIHPFASLGCPGEKHSLLGLFG